MRNSVDFDFDFKGFNPLAAGVRTWSQFRPHSEKAYCIVVKCMFIDYTASTKSYKIQFKIIKCAT